jgi:predicted XRE-type DNA-binding protein
MIEIETGSANVYADPGRADAGEMLVKAQLASRIGDIIKSRKLSQAPAAEVLGIPQPKLSGLLRGQFHGVSEAKMMGCQAKLGGDIRIVLGPARRTPARRSVKVEFG